MTNVLAKQEPKIPEGGSSKQAFSQDRLTLLAGPLSHALVANRLEVSAYLGQRSRALAKMIELDEFPKSQGHAVGAYLRT
jgi:hypothetical protein